LRPHAGPHQERGRRQPSLRRAARLTTGRSWVVHDPVDLRLRDAAASTGSTRPARSYRTTVPLYRRPYAANSVNVGCCRDRWQLTGSDVHRSQDPTPKRSATTSWLSPGVARLRSGRSRRTSASPSPACANWLRAIEVKEGVRPGVTSSKSAELRELRRHNRLLEQENEVLRRAATDVPQAQLPGKALPARESSSARGPTCR
jgi:transposase-like protein